MQAKVTEIARDVFCISTFHPEFGIQFNQFLVADEATIGKGVELVNFAKRIQR